MKVLLGTSGFKKTQQGEFKKIEKCVHCGKESRMAFVAYESIDDESDEYVFEEHDKAKNDFWVHDAMSCAVYLCRKCGKATAIYNQA